jgi:hypothetical protein
VGHASDPVLLVLNGVRLKGFAESVALADITGLEGADVDVVLADLAAHDLATHREGRVSGWALTPAGQAEHRQRVAAELDSVGCGADVEARYQEFLRLNPRLLLAATAWQMRDVDGQSVLNDHADHAHDARVLGELRQVHDEVLPLASALGGLLERYARYAPRLSTALARVEAGELDWFTKPLVDSYHTVWFEMHEDLLLTLGRQRSAEQEVSS